MKIKGKPTYFTMSAAEAYLAYALETLGMPPDALDDFDITIKATHAWIATTTVTFKVINLNFPRYVGRVSKDRLVFAFDELVRGLQIYSLTTGQLALGIIPTKEAILANWPKPISDMYVSWARATLRVEARSEPTVKGVDTGRVPSE